MQITSLLAIACLSACVGPKAADVVDDSAVNDTSPTFDPLECGGLEHPWVVEDADDIGTAVTLVAAPWALLTLVDGNIRYYVTEWPNPCIDVTVEGDTTTATGHCTTAYGVEMSGTWKSTERVNEDGSSSAVETFDHVHFLDPWYSETGTDFDGFWSYSNDSLGGYRYEIDAVGELFDQERRSGTIAWRHLTTYDDASFQMAGYADVIELPDSAATGDLCIEVNASMDVECDDVTQETDIITGTATGVLSWDGNNVWATADCGSCATVTIDGNDAGTWCE